MLYLNRKRFDDWLNLVSLLGLADSHSGRRCRLLHIANKKELVMPSMVSSSMFVPTCSLRTDVPLEGCWIPPASFPSDSLEYHVFRVRCVIALGPKLSRVRDSCSWGACGCVQSSWWPDRVVFETLAAGVLWWCSSWRSIIVVSRSLVKRSKQTVLVSSARWIVVIMWLCVIRLQHTTTNGTVWWDVFGLV